MKQPVLTVFSGTLALAALGGAVWLKTEAARAARQQAEAWAELERTEVLAKQAEDRLREDISTHGDLTQEGVDALRATLEATEARAKEQQTRFTELKPARLKEVTHLRNTIRGLETDIRYLNSQLARMTRRGEAAAATEEAATAPTTTINAAEVNVFISALTNLRISGAATRQYRQHLLALLPLMLNGASIDVTLPETQGSTALHYASALGYYNLVHWLIINGANVNTLSETGSSPLDFASGSNAHAIRALLISRGARRGR